jgi:LmbE family N-acetylglucosaminyl deacetylase
MFNDINCALVLAPHTDDGEFGCGGTLAKLVERGVRVFYVSFSSCEESVPDEFPKDILYHEMLAAVQKLGISKDNVISYNFPVRKFNYQRQEILENIILLKKMINPDLVFIPSLNDIHQDHKVIAEEGVRAFKNNTILSYELLWNIISFNNTCFVELSSDHVEKKNNAIQEYKSQVFRGYSNPEFIKAQARVRGVQVGFDFAEVFEVVRIFSKL